MADFPNITLIVTFVKVLANDTQKLQPFLEKGALFWFFFNISFILSGFTSGSCRPKFSFNQWMTGPSAESVAGLFVRGTSLSFMYSPKEMPWGGSPVCSRPSPTELLHYTKSCNGAVKWLVANVWILLSGGVTAGQVDLHPIYLPLYIRQCYLGRTRSYIKQQKLIYSVSFYLDNDVLSIYR